MFSKINTWGEHDTYHYDISKYNFKKYFCKLYNCDNLENLYLISSDYEKYKDIAELGFLNDRDTDLHKKFYNDIKNNTTFKELYCKFIKEIHQYFFPDEEYLVYQSFPSLRIQYLNSVAVPPHKDSDHLSNHPLGEVNFLIPITKMINTAGIFLESKCDKKDFKSISLNYGDILRFNGNTCTHFNKPNVENFCRISIDFRILPLSKYKTYIETTNLKKTNPRDIERNREPTRMLIGGYYQITTKYEKLSDMMIWHKIKNNIFQHRPTFGVEEAQACYNYMSQDTFVTEYKETTKLEKYICNYLNVSNCFMTTSGTCAIILALLALELQPGDEVIVPNYTMIATINAVKLLNLKPIIIDVHKDTFTLDIHDVKNYITPKTKCIIHVSLNNRHINLKELAHFCKNNNIYLIEDSAQSLGCKVDKKYFGTWGDIGCFSLSSPKIISTGQGGFCVTDNEGLANKIKMIKNFGRVRSGIDEFEIFGINLKFTDIQAVIGLEQMKKLDLRITRIREIYNLYYKELHEYVEMKKVLDDDWFPWFVDIYIQDRANLIHFLKIHFISSRPTYVSINKTNIYNDERELKNSNYVSTYGLFLPSYITITDEEILYICRIIKLYISIYN